MACGGGGGAAAAIGGDSLAAGDSAAVVVDSASGEPLHPEPVRGRLVARTAGTGALAGSWRARVGRCDRPRSLQIASDGDSVDVLLLLLLPDSGEPTREYPVMERDSAPPGGGQPHARIGVQRLGYMVASYQGASGAVRLDHLNRTASGSFDLMLREALNWDTVRYLGTFADLPVEPWSPEICGSPADSSP